MGTFILKKTKNGQYMFNLLANNYEIILTSESYTTKQNAINGIKSVKKNANDESFNRFTNDDGSHHFNLTAKNYEIIGCSEIYTSKDGMENGIKSVILNAPSAPIKDRTAWYYRLFY